MRSSRANAWQSFPPTRRLVVAMALSGSFAAVAATAQPAPPSATVVLVHGAMADSSSWRALMPRLAARGYAVVAAADPLRGLSSDADEVSAVIRSIKGPVVLVGHSYGGSVISNAAIGNDNVKALVYVAAFAPMTGESAFDLVGRFPGSELGAALAPAVPLAHGGNDLHVAPAKFRSAFAADVPAAEANLMALVQRPVTDTALKEASANAAWTSLPSWFVYGSADKSIPPAAHAFMAQRDGAKQTLVVKGASHAVMVSHPAEVAQLIDAAAKASVSQE